MIEYPRFTGKVLYFEWQAQISSTRSGKMIYIHMYIYIHVCTSEQKGWFLGIAVSSA